MLCVLPVVNFLANEFVDFGAHTMVECVAGIREILHRVMPLRAFRIQALQRFDHAIGKRKPLPPGNSA
jgi:hypothetical protein